MAEKGRTQYTREFKLEALRLLEGSGRSKAQVSRELSIRESLLGRWRAQLESRPAAEVFPGNGRASAAEEEIRRLRRENEILRQERDFLKKAAAYFAKEPG